MNALARLVNAIACIMNALVRFVNAIACIVNALACIMNAMYFATVAATISLSQVKIRHNDLHFTQTTDF
ncbi:hypothetical protein [Nostoc sp.]|uniref:hypothetical protein n=1 Tax=Nostoc sp. TaxID=1180 RepID=UPI002FFB8514